MTELEAVDAATGVRWLPVPLTTRRPALDPREFELLSWIAAARCALSSQAHRRTSPGQALTTTQRRLKRLADAGLVARFQLHGGDGGGVPFCCVATGPAFALLGITGRPPPAVGEASLASLRADLHTVGWLLALDAHAGSSLVSVLGPGRARVAPPAGVGPGELELEPGLHARDFVCGTADPGQRRPVESFVGVRPDAAAELTVRLGEAILTVDLLVFRGPAEPAEAVSMLTRLDHLVAGWWRLVPRYARLGGPPSVVILAGSRDSARCLAELADRILVACLARIGDPPDRWVYPAREGVVFVADADLHHGVFEGWRTAELPPAIRAAGPQDGPAVPAAEPRWGQVVLLADSPASDARTGKVQPPAPWR